MTEAELQSAIIQLAQLLGWRVHHCRPAQDRKGRWLTPISGDAGFPDLCMVRRGHVIFAELKSHVGRMTEDQRAWLHEAGFDYSGGGDRCCRACVWRPKDWTSGIIESVLKGEA
jgi:hypothetical protein